MGNKKKSKMQKQRRNEKKKQIAKQPVTTNTTNKNNKKPQLIDKNKVKYNVFFNIKKEDLPKKKKITPSKNITPNKKQLPVKKKNTSKKTINFKDILIAILKFLKNNIHILFNSILIIIFIAFLYGLIVTSLFSDKIIIYIVTISLFFMLIAMSYNKYISGKIFTISLCAIMIFGISFMNDTYNYINGLNTSYYETKTYYIVTFDNNTNKTIYNINNKSIGMLNNNASNIQKILDIKIDGAKYQTYDDINLLYSDFFAEKTRAIILNENEYIYLLNNIEKNSRSVKILETFTSNSPK